MTNTLLSTIRDLVRPKPEAEASAPPPKAAAAKTPPALKSKIKSKKKPLDHSVRLFHPLPPNQLACPVCQQQTVTHASGYPSERAPFTDWVVYYCSGCGAGHVPEGAALLGDYYTSKYSDNFVQDRRLPPSKYFTPENREKNNRYFARVDRQIAALKKQGARFDRVLDYGSGPGYFLHASQPKQAFAVEPDVKSHKYLDHIGATRITDDDLSPGSFDVIVASHVVEHFTDTDLHSNLQRLVRALAPGGRLLIEVPQAGHSYMKLSARNDPHTLFFSAEGLRRAAETAGGQVIAAYARSKKTHDVRHDAIYAQPIDLRFEIPTGGGLTVIVAPQAG